MKAITILTTVTTAAILTTTTFAAKAYIPTVNSPNNTNIHGQYVAANNGQFFIGKPTTAHCPDYDTNCTYNNVTIITGPTSSNSNWWMGILESGGQELYIPGGPAGGDMYYTAAHANYLPYKSDVSGWLSLGNTTDGRTKFLGFGADLSACPTDVDGVYSVHANYYAPNGCILFEMIATETTAAAPQYYSCVGCESRCYASAVACDGYFN